MKMILNTGTCPIGLDVGSECIKMIQLEPTRGGICVTAAAQYHFPPELGPDDPRRRELAVEAVRRLVKENRFRGRRVVSTIPDSDLAIKAVRLPPGNENNLEQLVRTEVARKLPFDVESAQLQYLDAGKVLQGEDPYREIIVLAAREEDIQGELDLLLEMSLDPIAIDTGPSALFRAAERFLLRREDEDQVSLVVDVGAANTKMVVGHGAEPAFVKIVNIGSRNMTRAVADALKLSVPEAVRLRKIVGSPTDRDDSDTPTCDADLADEVFAASCPVLTELAREISLCLRYHAVTFRGYRPASIRLAGSEADFSAIADFLSKTLGLPVEVAHPFKSMNTSAVELNSNRRRPAPGWTVSVGLALRGLLRRRQAPGEAA